MNIVYSIRQSQENLWDITLGPVVLIQQLQLGPAINMARQMARDAYARCGCTVYVEFMNAGVPVVLAHYVSVMERRDEMSVA
ncbi:hypothetical protein [Dyella sp. 20L07]|uniref:hypothetical protein n=1 Tax=Dyella sp. 20L07 TaxID=3384240 RepID=UPI003D2BF637